MDELLRQLLNELDSISVSHEEIFDTECREQMSSPIFHLYIKPKDGYDMPSTFGLYSEDADAKVRSALSRYIESASRLSTSKGLARFHERLASFQNGEIKSDIRQNYFDDYFGWMNPANFDDEGNVIRSC